MDVQKLEAQQQQHQQQQQQKEQQENMKKNLLGQVLSQEASARLNTLKLAKPDKAQYVESYVLQLASSGRMMGKMSEQELINVIEQVNRQTAPKKTKVNFDRRRAALDSDSD